MSDVIAALGAQRVVPVIRSASVADAIATVRACARAGMRLVELTHSVPDVEHAVRRLAGDELVLGIGTITDAAQLEPAADAGARFVVSFCRPPGFLERASACGLTAIPGAFTPSELAGCAAAGAGVVKLFPARVSGPDFVRDVRAVLPQVRLLATGGVRTHEIGAWLDAGAIAVGTGALGTVAADGADEVERRARAALAAAGVHQSERATRAGRETGPDIGEEER